MLKKSSNLCFSFYPDDDDAEPAERAGVGGGRRPGLPGAARRRGPAALPAQQHPSVPAPEP